MKKSIFSALFVVLTLFMAQYVHAGQIPDSNVVAHAAGYLGLTINGVEVTKSNADRPIPQKNVRYYHKISTLVLDNETLEFDDCVGIKVDDDYAKDFRILIKGDCSLKANFVQPVIESIVPIQIEGEKGSNPQLLINGNRLSSAIRLDDCPVKFHNLSVELLGGYAVLGKSKGVHNYVIIQDATVDATSIDAQCFRYIDGLSLMGTNIQNDHTVFSKSQRSVMCGAYPATNVRIAPAPGPYYYGIKVAGIEVNSDNFYDIKGDGIEGGRVSYDPEEKILRIKDATINGGEERAISSESGNALKVFCTGSVAMYSQADYAVFTTDSIRFLGIYDEDLWIEAQQGSAINGLYIRFANCFNVKIVGHEGAITGRPDVTNVIIRESSIKILSTYGAIYGVRYFYLADAEIEDKGTRFAESRHAVIDDSGHIACDLSIKPQKISYNIWVCGEEVTNLNRNDIKCKGIVSGHVAFDDITNTLVLTDAHISSPDKIGIVTEPIDPSEPQRIFIECKGDCSIDAKVGMDLYTYVKVYTEENSSLKINATTGIGLNGKRLILEGDMTIEGSYGLTDNHGFSDVTLRNFKGTILGEKGAITGISGLLFQHSYFTYPNHARFVLSEMAVMDGTSKATEVCIGRDERVEYGLKVAGVEVTSLNYDYIDTPRRGMSTIVAPPSYDPGSKTLTLDCTDVITQDCSAIQNTGVDGLIIKCVGPSSLSSQFGYGILSSKDFAIVGDPNDLPTLDVKGDVSGSCYALGFDAPDLTLTVRNVNLDLDARLWSISNKVGEANVKIYGSDVEIHSGVSSLSSFEVFDCKLVEPANGLSAFKNGCFLDDQDNLISHIKVEIEKYGFKVAGIEVTSANCKDISSPEITGKVSFDPTTNTLTLKNATIKCDENIPIQNESRDGLIIKCLGRNVLHTDSETAIRTDFVDCSLVGDGSSSLEMYANIWLNTCTLTIQDLNLLLFAPDVRLGIEGLYSEDRGWTAKVVVRHSNVEVDVKSAAVSDIDTFELIDCKMVRPVGGYFDTEEHGLMDEYDCYSAKLEIVADDISGLEDVKMDADDPNAPMFDLTGRQIYHPYRGQIYLQNGKKKIAL